VLNTARVFVISLLLLVVTAAPALANQITFNGSGWGHGIGLSQYGAKALGADGATYQEIIQRYFPNLTLASFHTVVPETFASQDETPIWVGLREESQSSGFEVLKGSVRLCLDQQNYCVGTAKPNEDWTFSLDGSGGCVFYKRLTTGVIRFAGNSSECATSLRPISPDTEVYLPFKARSYKDGVIRFRQAPESKKVRSCPLEFR